MKKNIIELDVDFIGGQGPLTQKEEQALSEFFQAQKLLNSKKQIRSNKTSQQRKAV